MFIVLHLPCEYKPFVTLSNKDKKVAVTPRFFKCTVNGCTATFERQLDRKSHLFNDHPDKVKYCPVCKKSFSAEKFLFVHVKMAHEKKELLKCQYCDKEFVLEESLSYHYDEEHEDEYVGPKDFVCPVPMCLKR